MEPITVITVMSEDEPARKEFLITRNAEVRNLLSREDKKKGSCSCGRRDTIPIEAGCSDINCFPSTVLGQKLSTTQKGLQLECLHP